MYIGRSLKEFLYIPEVKIPAPIYSIYYLIFNIVFFTILAWYFDNLFPCEEQGTSRPWYFPFTLQFWGISKSPRSTPLLDINENHSEIDSDVEDEQQQTFNTR